MILEEFAAGKVSLIQEPSDSDELDI